MNLPADAASAWPTPEPPITMTAMSTSALPVTSAAPQGRTTPSSAPNPDSDTFAKLLAHSTSSPTEDAAIVTPARDEPVEGQSRSNKPFGKTAASEAVGPDGEVTPSELSLQAIALAEHMIARRLAEAERKQSDAGHSASTVQSTARRIASDRTISQADGGIQGHDAKQSGRADAADDATAVDPADLFGIGSDSNANQRVERALTGKARKGDPRLAHAADAWGKSGAFEGFQPSSKNAAIEAGTAQAGWREAVNSLADNTLANQASVLSASIRDASSTADVRAAEAAAHRAGSSPTTGIAAPDSLLRSDATTAWATAATDTPARAFLPTPVGHPQWGTALGQQLLSWRQHAGQGDMTAELRLDPPDMGPLRVSLHIVDGVTTATFGSGHAAVRQALESALPQLHQAFADAGLALGQAQIGDSSQDRSSRSSSDAETTAPSDSTPDTPATDRPTAVRSQSIVGRIDTFA